MRAGATPNTSSLPLFNSEARRSPLSISGRERSPDSESLPCSSQTRTLIIAIAVLKSAERRAKPFGKSFCSFGGLLLDTCLLSKVCVSDRWAISIQNQQFASDLGNHRRDVARPCSRTQIEPLTRANLMGPPVPSSHDAPTRSHHGSPGEVCELGGCSPNVVHKGSFSDKTEDRVDGAATPLQTRRWHQTAFAQLGTEARCSRLPGRQ